MIRVRHKIVVGALIAVGVLALYFGSHIAFLYLNAAWAAGDGDGDLHGALSRQIKVEGGMRNLFFRRDSDIELAKNPDKVISENAASRLFIGRQCGQEDAMIDQMKTEERPGVQRWLLQALAACNSQKAIPVFRAALSSKNDMILSVAAQSLATVGAREAIPDLRGELKRCSGQCTGAIEKSLAQLGDSEDSYRWAIKVLTSSPPEPYSPKDQLKRHNAEQDISNRYYAAQVLQSVGTEKDIPLLERNRDLIPGTVGTDGIIAHLRGRKASR